MSYSEWPALIAAVTGLVTAVTLLIAALKAVPVVKAIHANTNNALSELMKRNVTLQQTQATAVELDQRPDPKVPL